MTRQPAHRGAGGYAARRPVSGRARRRVSLVSVTLSALLLTAGASHAQTLDEARALEREGSYDDAVRAYMRLARRGESPRAGRGLVRVLIEVGRYDDAVREARRFNGTQAPQLSNVLGEALYRRGDVTGAEAAFREAMEGGSDSLTARVNLGVLQWERGELDAAMRTFDSFIDVYSTGRNLSAEELLAVATAGRYLGERNFQLSRDALRVFDEAAALDPSDLEPKVRTGELFFDKYNNSDAPATFQGVLDANPRHPRALLGLARSQHFDGSPEAFETVRRSLEVNPNLVPARLFLARLYIELEEYERAGEEVTRAIDVNASSPQAWAMAAAVRYFQGDTAGFEAACRRALEQNPRYADLYNTLADLSARNRLYRQAVEFAERAVALDSQSWRGHGLLGMNQLRVGAIEAGRASLERSFALAPFDPWTKNTLDLLDTFSDYTNTRSRYFELVMDREETPALQLYLADVADEAYDRLAELYGHRPDTPIRLEVYPRHADFSVRTVGIAGLGALGVSFGKVLAMDSPSARELGQFHWASTLWHEVAHTFHMAISDHRVPRWFTEGLAVFEERRAHEGWGDDVSVGFLMAYMQDRLHPVSELNNGFVRPTYPQQVVFSYYLASLVCEFIQGDWGDSALVEMLRAYGRGLSHAGVLKSVLGMEVTAFDRAFDDYMRRRFVGPLSALRSPVLEQLQSGAMELPELLRVAARRENDFPVQLETGRALVRTERYDEAIPYLERAKVLFPEYAGSDSPYWYLAQVHRARGRPRRAVAELDALTAINGGHYAGHMVTAELRAELGDTALAAAALERAQYVYPFDMDVHRRLAELYEALGVWSKAIRERRAVLGLDPVDRAEAEYRLAQAYFASGNMTEARRAVLRALERAPNFEEALDLLLEIRSRRNGTQAW